MGSVLRALALCAVVLGAVSAPSMARAQAQATEHAPDSAQPHSLLELHFTPTRYAQIALWIEDQAGTFMATVGLTDAVAARGLGNRPGASQMNSGFRWPYGRREGVLPVWAHRRGAAPGAKLWKRVIFQNRGSEGFASRTSDDFSRDDYFCLSFNNDRSRKDALDAVSCASVFNSDKGRFITEADVARGYDEPYEDMVMHLGRSEPLSLMSLYPPRRDITSCAPNCYEHSDVAQYAAHAREVMPDIDAVTMATLTGGEPKTLLYSVPVAWPDGAYRACLEINVEGDYNARWNAESLPTPTTPIDEWDWYTDAYGYAYRGQPSVVYCVPFTLGEGGVISASTDQADGSVDSWDTAAPGYGELGGMEDMTDDPIAAPGSGADRLMLTEDGYRLKVVVKPPFSCKDDQPPSAVSGLSLTRFDDKLHAHEWAKLAFRASSDDVGVFRYEVRVSTQPITDVDSFMRAEPAKNASVEAAELRVPTAAAAGSKVEVAFGGMVAQTHYYVGVRAIDGCAHESSIAIGELDTPKRIFATVTPCFVATAAYGTPLASEISALRRLRDRYMASNLVGRAFVSAYMTLGPKLADFIREREELRSAVRAVLAPLVAVARELQD